MDTQFPRMRAVGYRRVSMKEQGDFFLGKESMSISYLSAFLYNSECKLLGDSF
jgi:hypothetical protein